MESPRLVWEWGTAYDLFMSLHVLYHPDDFGVRNAWAAGIRSRLPVAEREALEQWTLLVETPYEWIQSLPEPRDATTVLWALRQIPPGKRLRTLIHSCESEHGEFELFDAVAARGSWDETDRETLQSLLKHEKKQVSKKEIETVLDAFANSESFGERFLAGLQAFQEVFFAEEEKRIEPYLKAALVRAQARASELPLPDLLEELSRGLRVARPGAAPELLLVPCFWITPLIVYGKLSAERELFIFGARPHDVSLVPGEVVPENLIQALQALSDPTRLRILHYLTGETLTAAQLARRLRLRPPTVTHHLRTLRVAGLVHLTLEEGKEQFYTVRSTAIDETCTALKQFLKQTGD